MKTFSLLSSSLKAQTSLEKKQESFFGNANIFADVNADLFVYPPHIESEKSIPGSVLTIGDMHGNGLKFLYILIRHQMIDVSKEHYKRIIEIYSTPVPDDKNKDEATFKAELKEYKENIKEFLKILDPAFTKIKPELLGKIRLLGDLFSERSDCNVFDGIIAESCINYGLIKSITLSNHDYDAFLHLYNFNNPSKPVKPWFLPEHEEFKKSFINLMRLVELKVISLEWVNTLLFKKYKSLLKVIDYSIEEVGNKKILYIYTHAPNTFTRNLYHAAEILLNIKRPDQFSLDYFIRAANGLNQLIHESKNIADEKYRDPLMPFFEHRIEFLNDEYKKDPKSIDKLLPKKLGDYHVVFISGHDMPKETLGYLFPYIDAKSFSNEKFMKRLHFLPHLDHTFTLDNIFGKDQVRINIYHSKLGMESPKLELILLAEVIMLELKSDFLKMPLKMCFKEAVEQFHRNGDVKQFIENWQIAIEQSLKLLNSKVYVNPLLFNNLVEQQAEMDRLRKIIMESKERITQKATEVFHHKSVEFKK